MFIDNLIQSTGVPLVRIARNPSRSSTTFMRRGEVTVIAELCPERGASGATMRISPKGFRKSATSRIPLACMPSSLVMRMRGL